MAPSFAFAACQPRAFCSSQNGLAAGMDSRGGRQHRVRVGWSGAVVGTAMPAAPVRRFGTPAARTRGATASASGRPAVQSLETAPEAEASGAIFGGREGGRGKDGTRVGGALKMGPATCAGPRTIGFCAERGPEDGGRFSCREGGRDRLNSGLGAAVLAAPAEASSAMANDACDDAENKNFITFNQRGLVVRLGGFSTPAGFGLLLSWVGDHATMGRRYRALGPARQHQGKLRSEDFSIEPRPAGGTGGVIPWTRCLGQDARGAHLL